MNVRVVAFPMKIAQEHLSALKKMDLDSFPVALELAKLGENTVEALILDLNGLVLIDVQVMLNVVYVRVIVMMMKVAREILFAFVMN